MHSQPEAYVRTIIARTAVDEHRRAWRRGRSTADPPDPTYESVDPSAGPTLRAALLKLPPRQRQVVVLRYYERLSVRETAASLGITNGTVKSSCARGLATLNDLLTEGEELIRP